MRTAYLGLILYLLLAFPLAALVQGPGEGLVVPAEHRHPGERLPGGGEDGLAAPEALVWRIETVDSGGDVGTDTSLALDAAGHPHVSYYDEAHADVKYARFDGTSWHIETVDGGLALWGGGHTSLALDAAGLPHISYYDGAADVKYARFDGTSWHIETVDNELEYWGGYTSLALDAAGHPHISYWDDTNSVVKYARFDGTSWHIETVDGTVTYYTSLALDAAGHPHVIYGLWGDLAYARFDGTTWHIETVARDVNHYASLALDAEGHPHISYFDETNYDLKYAYFDGTAWHIETVDSQGDVGRFTSLALDAEGYAHISYSDQTNYDLKYARFDGTAWHIETVDSEGDVGVYTSLALDAAGRPQISYCAHGQGYRELRYAWRDSGTQPPDLGFRPSPDGYWFENDGRTPSWERFKESFANSEVEYSDGRPKPGAYLFYSKAYLPFYERGVCGGMASTALMFFAGSETRPAPGDTYSLSARVAWPVIEKYHGRQISAGLLSYYRSLWWANPSVDELYSRIKAALYAGNSDPMTIVFFPARGSAVGPCLQFSHVVVPYRIEEEPGERARVYVYDSNKPGDDSAAIDFDLQGMPHTFSYWTGFSMPGCGSGDFYFRSDQGWTLLLTPISQYQTHDAAVLPLSFGFLFGGASAAVNDSQGRSVGYVGGTLQGTIPDSMPLYPPISPEGTVPRWLGFSLPTGAYTATISEITTAYSFSAVLPSGFVRLDSLRASVPAGEDRLAISEDGRVIEYTTTAEGESPYSLEVLVEGITETWSYKVSQATLGAGGKVEMRALPAGLILTNTGSATTYDLSVQRSGPAGEETFAQAGLQIGAHDAHRLSIASLGQAQQVTLEIDRGADGTVDERETLGSLAQPAQGVSWLLWAGIPAMLLGGLALFGTVLVLVIRTRRRHRVR